MGRYYRFSKKVSEKQASEIIQKINKLDNVTNAQIIPEMNCLLVETQNDDFQEVMGKAVNICHHVADVGLSFDKFEVEKI